MGRPSRTSGSAMRVSTTPANWRSRRPLTIPACQRESAWRSIAPRPHRSETTDPGLQHRGPQDLPICFSRSCGTIGVDRRKRSRPKRGSRSVPIELARDLAQADAEADGSSVRAGGGEAAGEPVFYESLHLGLREPVAHLDGRVAGDGGEDIVLPAMAGVGAGDGREGVLEGAGDVAIRQRGDHGGHTHGFRPEGFGFEAVDGELFEVLGGYFGVTRRELDDLGNEQALHRGRAVGVVEPVEDGTLVGDVLVHDPQRRLRLLDEDVARRELAYDPQVFEGGERATLR